MLALLPNVTPAILSPAFGFAAVSRGVALDGSARNDEVTGNARQSRRASTLSANKVIPMANDSKATIRSDYPVLSDSQETDLRDAVSMIHAILGSANYSTASEPESRDAIQVSDVGFVFQRAMTALQVKANARRREAMAGVKAALDEQVSAARAERDAVLSEVSKLSPAMRTLLGVDAKLAALDVAMIPVATLLPAFPSGTTLGQAEEYLRTMLKAETANIAPHGKKGTDPIFAVRVVLAQPAAKVA